MKSKCSIKFDHQRSALIIEMVRVDKAASFHRCYLISTIGDKIVETIQGHLTSIFGKYLFGKQFEI